MNYKMIIIGVFMLLITSISAFAVEPTQQYYKAQISPLYRESMILNTNYTYTLNINTPDGISNITSAIILFNAQINGQTQNFTLWVNGQSCNNPNYYIATAFSTTGNTQIYFDCKNRITKNGAYNITIRSAVNTGVISGWLDLTYMNNPKGDLTISGTEYSPNDPATMFVQLKNSQGNPVQNGSCYLDVWYPNNATNFHPYTIQDAPMLQALGDDGIYYYDMTTPNILGVYMLSARCSYTYNWQWVYREDETVFYPLEQINSGTFQGGGNPQVLNSRSDGLYERCDGTLANPCSANYTFNISIYGVIPNISSVNVYFSGQDDTNGRILTMSYWNGTTFVNLANTLTFSGTGTTVPTAYDEFLTNSVPLNAVIGGTVKLRLLTAGSTRVFHNWLALTVLSSEGTLLDLKGSNEMHVTNISDAVWRNPSRNLTYYPSTNVSGLNVTVTVDSQNIADTVWNTTSRNLTYYQNFTQPQSDQTNYSRISEGVWNYSTRNLTYYQVTSINYSVLWEGTWNFTGRYVDGVLI